MHWIYYTFYGNVVNTKFDFQISYIFISISLTDKLWSLLSTSSDEILFNCNCLAI